MSTETDRQRVCVELRSGIMIVGDSLVADAFGVQVMRMEQPYGDRIPFHLIRTRHYYKASPRA